MADSIDPVEVRDADALTAIAPRACRIGRDVLDGARHLLPGHRAAVDDCVAQRPQRGDREERGGKAERFEGADLGGDETEVIANRAASQDGAADGDRGDAREGAGVAQFVVAVAKVGIGRERAGGKEQRVAGQKRRDD